MTYIHSCLSRLLNSTNVLRNSVATIGHGELGWRGLNGAAARGIDQSHPLPGGGRGRSKLTKNARREVGASEMTILETAIKIILHLCRTREKLCMCAFSMVASRRSRVMIHVSKRGERTNLAPSKLGGQMCMWCVCEVYILLIRTLYPEGKSTLFSLEDGVCKRFYRRDLEALCMVNHEGVSILFNFWGGDFYCFV